MLLARQRVAKHIPAKANARNNRSIASNGAVKMLCQQCRLCFLWGPCIVDVRESSSEAGVVEERERKLMEYEGVRWSATELACEKKT
jgi:hypothetical protein